MNIISALIIISIIYILYKLHSLINKNTKTSYFGSLESVKVGDYIEYQKKFGMAWMMSLVVNKIEGNTVYTSGTKINEHNSQYNEDIKSLTFKKNDDYSNFDYFFVTRIEQPKHIKLLSDYIVPIIYLLIFVILIGKLGIFFINWLNS